MIEPLDYRLLAALQDGLPLSSRPYAQISELLGIDEQQVLERLRHLRQQGVIKRLGVVVKHRQLGYRANAMLVFDVPDSEVDALGRRISRYSFVNLCYQRPRRDGWPYNLYCMIHGKSRDTVLAQYAQLVEECGLTDVDRQVLFSRRCFKQRGAVFSADS